MIKSKKRLILSWLMTLAMLLNVFFPFSTAYAAGTDATGVLTEVSATVSQGGTNIPENGTLSSKDNVSVHVSFRVPVAGDDPTPTQPVQRGDTATFALSDAFQLVSGGSIPLKDGDTPVGTVTFSTDSGSGMVYANVVFDGDPDVFTDNSYNTVYCQFDASLAYNDAGDAGTTGDHTVTILDKTYTVNVPPAEITYSVNKRGVADLASKTIEWTADLSATQGGAPLDLDGYQFYDDLADVGTYADGSFTVDGSPATPTTDGTAIRYTLPSGSAVPREIKFKTNIPDADYYTTSTQTISNTAQLRDSGDTVKGEGTSPSVSFTPQWITKTGQSSDRDENNNLKAGDYDPTHRTITWTITANQMGASLKNVVITDAVPDGLAPDSAAWQTWNGSDWDTAQPISPSGTNGDEYALGDIHSQVKLTIVTAVPDDMYTTGITTYTNSASIRSDELAGFGTGGVGVDVGYNAITKLGTADPATRTVHWTVGVDTRGQAIPDMKVYDLLVYGSSIDLGTVAGLPAGMTAGTAAKLTPRYGQKYIDSTFSGSGSVAVYPITQDGNQVADLLEITGLSTSTSNSFSFDSLVVNPDLFAGNTTKSVTNTASLFSGSEKINADTKSVNYSSKVLAKELLNRTAMDAPADGVNSARTKTAADGFDYKDKSVIFRLSINADGMDLSGRTDGSGQPLGAATVTDTLPAGWEFEDITSGTPYLIFEGTGNSDGTVQATDTTPDTVAGLNADFTTSGTAKFTFDDLNAPYVILVKAHPTDAAGYFDSNKTSTVTNDLALSAQRWNPGVSTSQNVAIVSQLLGKSYAAPIPADGTLTWTVNYQPYDLAQPGTRLEDTLPVGLDLRTDSSGALLLSDGNITVHEMSLNADGTYTEGAEVPLTLNGNVSYNNETRVLTFVIPDSSKAYRFCYVTDITGDPGTVSNHVSLYDDSSDTGNTLQSYAITALDGSASMQRSGWVLLTKQSDTGSPLPGATFTIFAQDGTTVIRTGVTGADGTVKLKVIPDGTYILRETGAPAGYSPEGVSHSLTVTTVDSKATASIDGKTGTGSNTLTVRDYLAGTVGNLTIRKTVAGNAADSTKAFDFTVTFSGADGTYHYTGSGVPNGTIQSGDTVSLAHGQSILIAGLPQGASYVVTEAGYAGYAQSSTGATGTIVADATQTASFVNTKNVSHSGSEDRTGSLTITKTVTGQGADLSKKFDFTVALTGAPGSYPYTGSAAGTLRSGDTVSLAAGDSITVTGLPVGAAYTVTEADYTADGYTVSSHTGDTGVISADTAQTASFTNDWSKVPDAPTSPHQPGTPQDPTGNIGGGDIPKGSMEGGETPKNGDETPTVNIDENIPTGAMDGDKPVMPKTGDTDQTGSRARLGLLAFSGALAAFSTADFLLRKKRDGKHLRK